MENNTSLDYTELINKTEQLIFDGRINGASKGTVVVQDIEIEGQIYTLEVSLISKKYNG